MPDLIPFDVDLTAHEGTRLAAVLGALGPHWDPVETYHGEVEACRLLYSRLDAEQQRCYTMLVAEGVLPDTVLSDAVGWPR